MARNRFTVNAILCIDCDICPRSIVAAKMLTSALLMGRHPIERLICRWKTIEGPAPPAAREALKVNRSDAARLNKRQLSEVPISFGLSAMSAQAPVHAD